MAESDINCLILEEVYYTASELSQYVKTISNNIKNVIIADSIDEANAILSNNEIGLIISNTHVNDGLTTEFLKNRKIQNPIIFFSGYEQNEENTKGLYVIDYLMLPISFKKVKSALTKYSLTKNF